MLKQLKQKKWLIIITLSILVLLAATGYFFAKMKSEPVYLTKIDRIMYDKKNRSPKYVLTMPEKRAQQKKPSPIEEKQSAEEVNTVSEPEDINDIIRSIPQLSSLGEAPGKTPLHPFEREEKFTRQDGDLIVPSLSPEGKRPWIAYGRKVNVQPNFYKVAVVIKNIGLNPKETDLIANGLPAEVSLSFSPYTVDAENQIKKTRYLGHETYMDLLLSSKDFLKSDTGPLAMSIISSIDDNIRRMKQTLSVNVPLGGVIINPGQADKENKERTEKLLSSIKEMGLLMIDATGEDGIDFVKVDGLARKKADILIDENLDQQQISQLLKQAEKIALEQGQVLIVASPKPAAVVTLNKWQKTFSPQLTYEQMRENNITTVERPFALVPVSAIVVE